MIAVLFTDDVDGVHGKLQDMALAEKYHTIYASCVWFYLAMDRVI